MARLYNQKQVAVNVATLGDQRSVSFRYKGFSSKEPTRNFKLYDLDLIKTDLLNHFYIRKGEKLENPEFGTILWDILFEPFTEEVKNLIAKDVENIVNYDPRVSVTAVNVDSTDQGIRIEAEINYLQYNVNERMTLNFDRNTSEIN